MRISSYLILVVLLVSCNGSNNTQKLLDNDLSLKFKKIVELKENINNVGDITSFDFMDESHFVISSSSGVFVYSLSGEQEFQVGDVGRGPFEYQNPDIVKAYNNNIYVWDAHQLKLIVYSEDGGSKAEYADFGLAIDDFIPYKNYILFYMTGSKHNKLLTIYDLSTKKELYSFGEEPSPEHIMLDLNKNAGGMIVVEDTLLYCYNDKLSIFSYDLKNKFDKSLTVIKDDEFEVSNLNAIDVVDLINSDMKRAIDYSMSNSYVCGLYKTQNSVVLRTNVGEFEYSNNSLNPAKRFQKFYVLNDNMKLEGAVREEFNFDNGNLYASNGNSLFHIKFNNSDILAYEMYRVDIN